MMKREWTALAVAIVLLAASILNIRHVDTVTEEIGIALCKSKTAAEQLNFKNSRAFLDEGLKIWQENESYTRFFMAQQQLDETTHAFYELNEKLNEEDILPLFPAYDSLLYRIESILSSEKISVGSIF